MLQLLWKTVWLLLKKLNIELPYDPTIPLLIGTPPKKLRTGVQTKTWTKMFIAAKCTVAKR